MENLDNFVTAVWAMRYVLLVMLVFFVAAVAMTRHPDRLDALEKAEPRPSNERTFAAHADEALEVAMNYPVADVVRIHGRG